jgi:hypothetical protein
VFASERYAERASDIEKVELLNIIEVLPLPRSTLKNADPEPTSDESEIEEDEPEDEDPKPTDGPQSLQLRNQWNVSPPDPTKVSTNRGNLWMRTTSS